MEKCAKITEMNFGLKTKPGPREICLDEEQLRRLRHIAAEPRVTPGELVSLAAEALISKVRSPIPPG